MAQQRIPNYNDLLRQSDSVARNQFNYDPRIGLAESRRFEANVPAFNQGARENQMLQNPDAFIGIPEGGRSDPSIVQATPQTVEAKRYIIVDTAQRDWTKQPNPYSNLIFTFGSQTTTNSNTPVYSNNPFIPTFADEQQNAPSIVPGLPNTTGWTLSNIKYPAYNSSVPKGNFVGYDTGYIVQASGAGFGSVFTPCNVQSIRLVRAVLPQRQFLSIPIVPNNSNSAYIESNIIGKPYSTFSTYPYLLFNINEYFGQYVGGNEPVRRSFSVMTQKGRTQTDFQIGVGVQQYDYEPWGEEALSFQSPLTNLQRVQLSVADPNGVPFSQNDNLSIQLIQSDSNKMYLKCFTNSYQYFSSNELRVGDRVVFNSDTLSNIFKSEVLDYLNNQKRQFVQAMIGQSFPVLKLLDYIPDSNGIYVDRSDISGAERTTPYVSSYNGFLIPNFTTTTSNGAAVTVYPDAIDKFTSNVLEPNLYIGSNIPVLNTTLQPVYVLELKVLQPDTGKLGGSIVV